MTRKPEGPLRSGWTTGACAAAAACGAYRALASGAFSGTSTIRLPRGELPTFDLIETKLAPESATAAVIKDAGDDPDVTHGAKIVATVARNETGAGITFHAGSGVGKVTKPGLPIPPGQPAINPKPRQIMRENLTEIAEEFGLSADIAVTVSVPGGEALAEKTWNPRLGIVGGISILGTTGVVVPFSCSAWIHSIHRGIDVARAAGLTHVAGSTGNMSEDAVRRKFDLPLEALLDMGDFAGGLLKYLRRNPLPRLTLAGGFAKMLKLAQGNLDLHSSRSQVDFNGLSDLVAECGGTTELVKNAASANTAAEVLNFSSHLPLAETVARRARQTAMATLSGGTQVDVLIVDREGSELAYVE